MNLILELRYLFSTIRHNLNGSNYMVVIIYKANILYIHFLKEEKYVF